YYFGGTGDLSTPDRIEATQANEGGYIIDKLGDVDGDGFEDIGIAYTLYNVVHFDISWGGSWVRQNIMAGLANPSAMGSIIGIGDVNNDGFDDFAIGYITGTIGEYSTYQRLYYGNPGRDFNSFLYLVQYPGMVTWRCLPLGDLNGDGFDDFFAYASSNGLMIWYGSGNIAPDNADIVLNPVYYGNISVRGIKAGDFNGDGFNDVVGASYIQRRFAVWLGNTVMNGVADWQKSNILENFGYDVTVGDFNGDGYDDIAVSAPFEGDTYPLHDFRGYVFIYAGNPGMVANDDPYAPPISDQLQMRISPNPIRHDGDISIALSGITADKGSPITIEVYNLKGQIVQESEIINLHNAETISTLSVTDLASGVYICRAKLGGHSAIKKFTIIK
ncbi:MAG: FG-GAP-like repeat-containing protein, partial [Candidatus Cloacimonadaceae bacterium]|nr:FG-GAP-like repeat-containing protein [Candidatus Cloacimonadaceae bacterium]